jgi:hypothetical protein
VMAHPELAPDQGRDAPQRPLFGVKASRHRPAFQQPAQPRPSRLVPTPRSASPRPRSQPAPPATRHRGRPAADTCPADPEPPANCRLAQAPIAQQHRGRQAPLLHLLCRPARRPPRLVAPLAPLPAVPTGSMLHRFREGH